MQTQLVHLEAMQSAPSDRQSCPNGQRHHTDVIRAGQESDAQALEVQGRARSQMEMRFLIS